VIHCWWWSRFWCLGTSALIMETVCSSEILAIQPTSTWCKYPKAGSTSNHRLSGNQAVSSPSRDTYVGKISHTNISFLTYSFILHFYCYTFSNSMQQESFLRRQYPASQDTAHLLWKSQGSLLSWKKSATSPVTCMLSSHLHPKSD
jgi:hypothetical protein